jgi:hypothetical protein
VRRPTPLEFDRLGFLPLADWDEYNSYEEDIPSRLRHVYLCQRSVKEHVGDQIVLRDCKVGRHGEGV